MEFNPQFISIVILFWWGLFKNVQMQGAQEPYREAYYTYVERCGLQRNAADERFFNSPFSVRANLFLWSPSETSMLYALERL